MLKWFQRFTDALKFSFFNDALASRTISQNVTSGVKVNENTALNLTSVYSAVRVISEEVAALPFPVYKRMSNGGKQRDTNHPVHDLLNFSPDGEITSLQWREAIMAHVLTWGNGYSEIERTRGGEPLKLHLIRPDIVTPQRTKSGQVVYKIGESSATIPAANMIHLAGLGFDGLMGYSPIRQNKETIGLSIAATQFGAAFFGNNSRPGGIVTIEGKATDEMIDNIQTSFNDIHGGPSNYGKLAFFPEMKGLNYQQLGVAPEEAQFLSTRVFQLQEICRIYRLPCTFLQENSRSTFSNTEQEAINFTRHTLRPWCKRIEMEFQRKLFSEDERKKWFAEHLMDGILRGDTLTRTAALHQQFMDGIVNYDEWREIENRNPIEDPYKHFIPMNMTTIGDMEDARNKVEEQPVEPPPVEEPTEDEPQVEEPQPEEQPPVEEPQQNSMVSPLMIEAAKKSLEDVLQRMARREEKSIVKAGKNPNQFLDSIDEFYDGHAQFVAMAIEPALKTYAIMSNRELNPLALANTLCQDHYSELLELSGEVTAADLPAAIEKKLHEWSQQEFIDKD